MISMRGLATACGIVSLSIAGVFAPAFPAAAQSDELKRALIGLGVQAITGGLSRQPTAQQPNLSLIHI